MAAAHSKLAKPPGIKPLGLRSLRAKPLGIKPLGIKPLGIKSLGIRPLAVTRSPARFHKPKQQRSEKARARGKVIR